MREVDYDLSVAFGEQAQRIARVDLGGQRQVVGILNGLDHGRPDLALAAQHSHSHVLNPSLSVVVVILRITTSKAEKPITKR
jgi:hypothetical protein